MFCRSRISIGFRWVLLTRKQSSTTLKISCFDSRTVGNLAVTTHWSIFSADMWHSRIVCLQEITVLVVIITCDLLHNVHFVHGATSLLRAAAVLNALHRSLGRGRTCNVAVCLGGVNFNGFHELSLSECLSSMSIFSTMMPRAYCMQIVLKI